MKIKHVTSSISGLSLGLVLGPLLLLNLAEELVADDTIDTSGPIVMRGNYHGLAWWVVDPETRMTAFFGGDIQEICRNDPNMFDAIEGFSHVRYLVVEGKNDSTGLKDIERGKDVGTSLWDRPPPFRLPQLCTDILSREPIATGTARINLAAVNMTHDPNARGNSTINFSGQGSMQKADGQTIRVKATNHCNWPASEGINVVYECRSTVDVR